MNDAPPPPEAKPPVLPRGGNGWFWLAAKVAVSAGILAVVVSRLDFAHVANEFATLSPAPLVLAVAAIGAANCLAGYRWSLLTARLEAKMSPQDTIGIYLAALFVGQILPSTLGVDAVRAWLAQRKYRPLTQVVGAILVDRAFGMAALGALMLLGAPFLLQLGDLQIGRAAWSAFALLVLAILGAGVATTILLRARLKGRLARAQEALRTVFAAIAHREGAAAFAASVGVHGLLTLSIVLIADSLGFRISLGDALATIPAAMLIAAIPISINGWGLREGAMVACLGLADVPESTAFVVSILFGIGLFVSALPGGAYWIFARKGPAG